MSLLPLSLLGLGLLSLLGRAVLALLSLRALEFLRVAAAVLGRVGVSTAQLHQRALKFLALAGGGLGATGGGERIFELASGLGGAGQLGGGFGGLLREALLQRIGGSQSPESKRPSATSSAS
ncbi:hypothetical protein ACLESD_42965, partial [Pyxidicoccus sp. 3LFB2]